METLTTCPRGHALAPDAVYCTTCWIRVTPGENASATRGRRRRMLIAIPLIGAASIVVGVAVGAMIAGPPTDVADPVAAPAAAPLSSVVVPSSAVVPVEQPVSVAVAPLAATVPDPSTEPAPPGCVVAVRGSDIDCTLTDGQLEFTVCVPGATTFIRVGTRPDNTVKFQDAVSEVVLGMPSSCAAEEITATVRIDAYAPAVMWRIVGRDATDEKIWKSRVVTAEPAP